MGQVARMLGLALTAMAVCSMAAVAQAGVVAPTKPSQEVNLISGSACGTGLAFDTQIDADGAPSAFSIPAGQVLVLDHLAWIITGAVAGTLDSVLVSIDGGIAVWTDAGIVDSSGSLAQNIALPNIPIRAGHNVCAYVGGFGSLFPLFTRVHGFLAKDK